MPLTAKENGCPSVSTGLSQTLARPRMAGRKTRFKLHKMPLAPRVAPPRAPSRPVALRRAPSMHDAERIRPNSHDGRASCLRCRVAR